MRVLVTGSVDWIDPAPLDAALDALLEEHPHMILITGMASGADALARDWARRHGIEVWAEPLDPGHHPMPMHRYNERMLSWSPDLVLACKDQLDLANRPDAGTEHMWRTAVAAGVAVRWLQGGDQAT